MNYNMDTGRPSYFKSFILVRIYFCPLLSIFIELVISKEVASLIPSLLSLLKDFKRLLKVELTYAKTLLILLLPNIPGYTTANFIYNNASRQFRLNSCSANPSRAPF